MDKGTCVQSYGFSSSHVQIWELDHKEGWALKNWCFWTVVLEKTLESLLDNKEIKPVNPKGNQFWIFIERTDAEAEDPTLWPLDVKSRLFGKDPDAGKDWGQEEKGATEDEMVGWHHRLNGQEFELAPGDSAGQGILECCRPWGHDVLDTTERLNSTAGRKPGAAVLSITRCRPLMPGQALQDRKHCSGSGTLSRFELTKSVGPYPHSVTQWLRSSPRVT